MQLNKAAIITTKFTISIFMFIVTITFISIIWIICTRLNKTQLRKNAARGVEGSGHNSGLYSFNSIYSSPYRGTPPERVPSLRLEGTVSNSMLGGIEWGTTLKYPAPRSRIPLLKGKGSHARSTQKRNENCFVFKRILHNFCCLEK